MLSKKNAKEDPFAQFEIWFDEALDSDFIEPSAMNIATVNKHGEISSRMVLLKSFNKNGFVFFTNYKSNKAIDLLETKKAALNFWWDKLHRQVRINGGVEKISRNESVEYFNTRARGSQIGALASNQSQVIESFDVLEQQFQALEKNFTNKDISCPDSWGGYRVVPTLFEFWQGRPNRLHDRLRYTKISASNWKIERLSP